MKKLFLLFVIVLITNNTFSQNEVLSIVTTHDEIDLSEVNLTTIPTKGPYLLSANQISSLLELNDMPDIVLPDSILIDDIIWTGDDFIVHSGYEIISLNNFAEPLMDFDTPDFEIFPLDEKHIYIVSHQQEVSLLFLVNLKVKRAKRILTIGERIVNVSQLGEATMVATENNIYLFKDKECMRYLSLWSPLRTAVMTSCGLVFATDSSICLLIGVDQFLWLFEAQTKRLLYDSQYLYIQLKDGDLLRCDISAIVKE